MKIWTQRVLFGICLLALGLPLGCPRDLGKAGAGLPSHYLISLAPDGAGGYSPHFIYVDSKAGGRIYYPGVSATVADLTVTDVTVNPAGTIVGIKITCQGGDIGMLWLRLLKIGGADLVSQPTVDGNSQGQRVFVLGPMAAGGSLTFALTFDHPAGQSFNFAFDLLSIAPRVAYNSDRALPGNADRSEIYTVDPETMEGYTVTHDSPKINTSPVWSPGGEWIAYNALDLDWCVDSWAAPSHVTLLHPDGSTGGYGGRVAQGVFASGNPAFNPTGELMAYYGRRLCEKETSDTSIDIYLYDIKSGAQTVWFSGDDPPTADDFREGQVYTPEWSPDGNYVIMSAQHSSTTIRWYYAPVDPMTGDTIPVYDSLHNPVPVPIFFSGHGLSQVMADGEVHVLRLHELAWGPDSRHIVARAADYIRVVNGSTVTWPSQAGVIIFDFQQVLDAPSLPIIPEFQWVAKAANGAPNYPGMDMTGDQVWFDSFAGSQTNDLQYVTLTGYAPPAPLVRSTFLNDPAFKYKTPALWPPALSPYFPLLP